MQRVPCEEIMDELKSLVNAAYDDAGAAEELNRRGHRDARGDPFTPRSIQAFRRSRKWPSCTQLQRDSLRQKGYTTQQEIASFLGIRTETVRQRARRGRGIEACSIKVGQRTFAMYRVIPQDTGIEPEPNRTGLANSPHVTTERRCCLMNYTTSEKGNTLRSGGGECSARTGLPALPSPVPPNPGRT